MCKLSNEELEALFLPVASQIADLNARCCALEAVVAWLGKKMDVPPSDVKTLLDHVYGQVLELELRKLEDHDARMAARLDSRLELPVADYDLQKILRRLLDGPQQPPDPPKPG
jgi:hypothetical protein